LIRPFDLHGLTVEPQDGTISGPMGQVQVDPQVMAVLVLLFQRAGNVVSREELLERVWQGRVVSDDAISRCIYQLRRHMSQAGGSSRYRSLIETLPKRGYRLNVRGLTAHAGPSTATRAANWKVFALLVVVAGIVAAGAKVWVLERSDASPPSTADRRVLDAYASANEYYRRADHRTALPYAVELYRQAAALDPTFGPAWVGLARAHTDIYWHGIDRTPMRLREAETALSHLLALGVASPEARFARANYLLKGRNEFQSALNELEAAGRTMADEPELYFLRAMAHRRLGAWTTAIEDLKTALDLDPGNITYLRQQFVSYEFVRDFDRAGQILDRILELHPDDGTAYVDRIVLSLCRDGDTTPFHRYDESAPSPYYDDGNAYTYTSWLAAVFDRDYEAALRILDRSRESQILDGDFRNASFGPKVLFYARTYSLAGRPEEAQAAYAAVIRMIEESTVEGMEMDDSVKASRYLGLAEAQAGIGERAAALESVHRASDLVPRDADALIGSSLLLNAAVRVLAPAGFDDEALHALQAYLGGEGNWSLEGLSKDPRLESLIGSRGFKRLEKQYARR